jgi:hypothetical protein
MKKKFYLTLLGIAFSLALMPFRAQASEVVENTVEREFKVDDSFVTMLQTDPAQIYEK